MASVAPAVGSHGVAADATGTSRRSDAPRLRGVRAAGTRRRAERSG